MPLPAATIRAALADLDAPGLAALIAECARRLALLAGGGGVVESGAPADGAGEKGCRRDDRSPTACGSTDSPMDDGALWFAGHPLVLAGKPSSPSTSPPLPETLRVRQRPVPVPVPARSRRRSSARASAVP